MENPNNGLNRIVPGNAAIMGQNIEVVADVDPEKFPNGLEVVFFVPGQQAPIGRGLINKGCMVGIVPPEMARMIRDAMKQHMAKQRTPGPGEVKAPGL